MKNVGFNKVQTMSDVNVELDKLRRLLVKTPEETTVSSAIPGEIKAWPGSIIPSGYLDCDGREVSKTDYQDLYNAIGDEWGTATNSSFFVIPDLRSATLRGVGTPTLYTSNTVITLAQIIDDAVQSHQHNYGGVYNYAFKAAAGALGVITSSGQTVPGATAGVSIGRTGLETTGKARGVYFIIKY